MKKGLLKENLLSGLLTFVLKGKKKQILKQVEKDPEVKSAVTKARESYLKLESDLKELEKLTGEKIDLWTMRK